MSFGDSKYNGCAEVDSDTCAQVILFVIVPVQKKWTCEAYVSLNLFPYLGNLEGIKLQLLGTWIKRRKLVKRHCQDYYKVKSNKLAMSPVIKTNKARLQVSGGCR